ncbi:MAG: polysaccharide deacetylase family protein [Gammaproteobacteria bacterium]|nr:polysaccharide deacetylase family protein [Gammaproteobacteria bacterium]MDH5239216.1 polysaccharide deacetylase family protein [Gammaproteobacteria bacterium]MDH5259918.1 polysaccharide deacetylase family protein [Gammaproteobacteria bacterium]
MKASIVGSPGILPLLMRLNAGRRLLVLIYHRVLEEADPFRSGDVTAAAFESQISLLQSVFTCQRFSDAVSEVRNSAGPTVAVTFDDGYKDNFEVALPILKRYGVPATFFVATGFLDGRVMWNDTVIESIRFAIGKDVDLSMFGLGWQTLSSTSAAIPVAHAVIKAIKYLDPFERQSCVDRLADQVGYSQRERLMMEENEIRGLHRAGMEIGAHTVSHPILKNIREEEARREIRESKSQLEAITGAEVTSFAYPNGRPGSDFTGRDVDLVRKSGFEAAATTAWAAATDNVDRHAVPRVSIWGSSKWKLRLQISRNFRHVSASR